MLVVEQVVLHKDLPVGVVTAAAETEEHLLELMVAIMVATEQQIEVEVEVVQVQVMLLYQVVPEVQELLY